ncbi:S8 family peptidase [Anditalea andensis]|uniref:Peptidase S8 n=1 Tax=Anditalea andensis TaxID=1048983 RepID=A0A074KYD2_9BACT|nr:S8 family peptidase [Anditalea andensis]KEO73210.1 peptidase S8 [Anditalea andensis]
MNLKTKSLHDFLKLIFAFTLVASVSGCATTARLQPIGDVQAVQAKNAELNEYEKQNWLHLDLKTDTIPGMSVDRAYSEIIKNRTGETVTVAVLDSGIDLEHEDLRGLFWVNSGEIAGSNADDDGNGYVDDVHGYNFLGDSYHEQLEFTRILQRNIGDDELQQAAKAKYDETYTESMQGIMQMRQIGQMLGEADSTVRQELGKDHYGQDDLMKLRSQGRASENHVGILMQMLSMEDSISTVMKMIDQGLEHYQNQIKFHLNVEFNGRIPVGDDPYDIDDQPYGNGNPMILVKEESHGTHVAGIIAANRTNEQGVRGVANNVRIMSIRAVPDGDEYDKDIALGIRYAVDNGARIINASFGKSFSPNAEWVYDAIKYAAEHDVLIVHAAGNDGIDLDDPANPNYPNDHMLAGVAEISDNVLTVGALTSGFGQGLVAPFSNYGRQNVDVFAPGAQIYSTMPEDEYEYQSGTSMAAPAVAGLAALIRSYYPKLTANQVKQIIMESGLSPDIKVQIGGEEESSVTLSEISRSGKIANAYNALIMADRVSRGKMRL